LWALAILLVFLGILMMCYTFIQLQISKWFDRKETDQTTHKYWRNISIFILIASIGPMFINNEETTLAVDYDRFPAQIEFTDDYSAAEMIAEKEDLLSFLSDIEFVDMT